MISLVGDFFTTFLKNKCSSKWPFPQTCGVEGHKMFKVSPLSATFDG